MVKDFNFISSGINAEYGGSRGKEAADLTQLAWINFMSELQMNIENTYKAASSSLNAMRHAHKVLLEGHQNPNWKAETVTLLGCMAMKLSSLEINSGLNNRSWFVLCCCIGNSKVFRWNVGKKSIREITKASVVLDETTNEPSGRLGAFSGDKPDLNNFSLYSKMYCHL
eukprot:TRINITY_DN4238_c0_g6_i2.p1 TRINITY_DN4238_c0_g6~~TRINITY_DN4238_c0_g6_i2.p1  ORF type:complete len:169 (-),score=34.13 TRINITY_DN4238_c0_g6_i2:85-591(-)